MSISIIVAMSQNRVIGVNNKLPWHIPRDMHYFREKTYGKPIIMGRKTYDSIGHPLEGRRNIVISRNPNLQLPGCEIFYSLEQALNATAQSQEVMVIGGAEIYQQVLPQVDKMYLTIIYHDYVGDAFFPEFDPVEWQEISLDHCPDDPEFTYPYSFIVLQRKTGW